jgi:hypothetical protein
MENKNLNLVNILKDCPKGTKLYSTVHGVVEFEKIIIDDTFPIKFSFKVNGKNSDLIYAASVSIDGKYATKYNGECILFPSKDQRDWSKFNVEPKFDISTLQPFDKVLIRDNDTQSWRCDFYNSYAKSSVFPFITVRGIYKQCIPYNEDTKHLVSSNELPSEKYITWKK